jgi:hypothetical protein
VKNPKLWGTLGAMAAHAAGVPGGALLGHIAGSGVAHGIGSGNGKDKAKDPGKKLSLPASATIRGRGKPGSTVDSAIHQQAQAGARGRGRGAGSSSGTASLKPPPGLSGAELRQHHSDGLRTAMNTGDNEGINYHAGEINKLNKASA